MFQAVGANYPCLALVGPRSLHDEEQAIASGHSHLVDPFDSKHVVDPVKRPFALAADVAPDPLDFTNTFRFWHFAGFVLATAKQLNIKITWGGAWRGDFAFNAPGMLQDLDHFELSG